MTTLSPFRPRWRYTGDMNLEHGGLFWRPGSRDPFPEADYVEAVCVTGIASVVNDMDAEGLFLIEQGSIYMPRDKYETALKTCGYTLTEGPRGALSITDGMGESFGVNSRFGAVLLVDAFNAYWGLDGPARSVICIGPVPRDPGPELESWVADIDQVYRGNSRLARIVRRDYL